MTRPEIYTELQPLAEFICMEDVGHVRLREAWDAIDYFLDQLIEIQRFEEDEAI